MATAVEKITLASSRDIPFNKLALSQANVRRVKAGISVEELAESIARRGLIQSLHVRPVLDAEGKETGMFEVPAGGRRYRALELLVKQKRLAKTAPVPCVISEADADILIDEVSLAENIERAPLHPLDQFRAFQALRNKAMSEEATRDGRITPYQRRRIRLMMRAADGRANGATYREIANALFGPERVAAEPWKTSPLRDAVIGLIESAGPLINGGYRKLLRHRRRS